MSFGISSKISVFPHVVHTILNVVIAILALKFVRCHDATYSYTNVIIPIISEFEFIIILVKYSIVLIMQPYANIHSNAFACNGFIY